MLGPLLIPMTLQNVSLHDVIVFNEDLKCSEGPRWEKPWMTKMTKKRNFLKAESRWRKVAYVCRNFILMVLTL